MTIGERRANIQFNAEFLDTLQLHANHIFPGSYFILNTSTRHYQVAANLGRALHPAAANSFYNELLDFSPQNLLSKRTLRELLNGILGDAMDGASFCHGSVQDPSSFLQLVGRTNADF